MPKLAEIAIVAALVLMIGLTVSKADHGALAASAMPSALQMSDTGDPQPALFVAP